MIVKAKCSVRKKPFAITFQKAGDGVWEAQTAFDISEDRAKKGYGQETLQGSTRIGGGYPGCPICGSKSFFLCNNCQTLNCQGTAVTKEDGRIYVSCANCGPVGYLQGSIEKLDGFGDI